MDVLPATELVNNNPELKILDIDLLQINTTAVAKVTAELLNKVNEVLTKLIEDGKIRKIYHSTYKIIRSKR